MNTESNIVTSAPAEKNEAEQLFLAAEHLLSGSLAPERYTTYRKAREIYFRNRNEPMFCLSCKSFFAAGRLYLRAHRVIPNRIELICPLCYGATTVLADRLAQLPSFRHFCEGLKHTNMSDVI